MDIFSNMALLVKDIIQKVKQVIVEEHVYSRGQFVKKAIHWASCVQGT